LGWRLDLSCCHLTAVRTLRKDISNRLELPFRGRGTCSCTPTAFLHPVRHEEAAVCRLHRHSWSLPFVLSSPSRSRSLLPQVDVAIGWEGEMHPADFRLIPRRLQNALGRPNPANCQQLAILHTPPVLSLIRRNSRERVGISDPHLHTSMQLCRFPRKNVRFDTFRHLEVSSDLVSISVLFWCL
jgi:hypothetical protein